MKSKKALKILLVLGVCSTLAGCGEIEANGTKEDVKKQSEVSSRMSNNQSTPTDINYSLERYNLIKRAYWVNGEREKANSVLCPIEKPIGYVILFTESGNPVGNFCVDGKVTSLNSYLTPDYTNDWKGSDIYVQTQLSDVDGSYGENDAGIFFFTPDGKYIEWSGLYLYSDIAFPIDCMLTDGEVE